MSYGVTSILLLLLVNEAQVNPRNNFKLLSGSNMELLNHSFFLLLG